ncbi:MULTISPECIES: HIT domain-containing protein [Salinivibrio]|uniref:HIT domain-containing protein n=1 Tax=Salinivibrio TaxID=51366 RepID=UPI000E314B4B|nr:MULTISPECIES: HIT domain-containing protein [Salinivibrio]WBA18751.1 HIT domain-containing protein [Salinivibrio kushneri]
MSFVLHSRLAADSAYVGDFPLCQLRLAHADIGPWLLLIPRKRDIEEIHHLDDTEQQSLWQESAIVARCLERLFYPDKLNIAAIGNLVPQLHLHHVARFKTDPVWPNPIWGHLQVGHRPREQTQPLIDQLRETLAASGLVIKT